MKSFVKGQLSMFDANVQVSEPKPAPKQTHKPKQVTVYYKFICECTYDTYIVYAQHEAQAFAKCCRMHGQRPSRIYQEY